MGEICWFLYKTIYWHVVALFVLMPSISTGGSTFAWFSLVYNGKAALHCIAALFERLPAGTAITPLPTAPALLGAGSHITPAFWDMSVKEKIQCKGIRKEKWEKAGSNQSKRVVEKMRGPQKKGKGEEVDRKSPHIFSLISWGFFPALLFSPFLPSPFHPVLLLPWLSFPTSL